MEPWTCNICPLNGREARKQTMDISVRRRRKLTPNGGNSVFHILRERIASHGLPPGSRLREQDLASEFGVSRARIREAFGALEQRGLIERIPNRGAVVVRLDPEQFFDLYDIREVLEAFCIRRATLNAPDGAWNDLIERFDAPLEKAIAEGDFDAYLDGLEAVRQGMIKHAGSKLLSDMLDLIYDRTRVISRRIVILPGRGEIGRQLHLKMLEAMARRDVDAAERGKKEILSSARDYLSRYQAFVF